MLDNYLYLMEQDLNGITNSNVPNNLSPIPTGWPLSVLEPYENLIYHRTGRDCSQQISSQCLMYLIKSNQFSSIINVPDTATKRLYPVCQYGDGYYVLYVDPQLFLTGDEHFIISGLEVGTVDDDRFDIRRSIRLFIPKEKKYAYVPDKF